ncbi:MAG: anthranilate synthase component I family protein [Bacteroidetes bacterium]|nr:anthranilate synthase component I family protein [Bacteroidota bacterium]
MASKTQPRTFNLKTRYRKKLSDTVTPVSVYLQLRDHFANTVMLESSDYHGNDNTYSFICFSPMAEFRVTGNQGVITYPDDSNETFQVEQVGQIPQKLQAFIDTFQIESLNLKFSYNGLFGYQAYDMVRNYDTVDIQTYQDAAREIPDMIYQAFRYMIVINHFNNEMYLFEHYLNDEPSQLDRIETLVSTPIMAHFGFQTEGAEGRNCEDEDYLEMVRKGIEHCHRGDVFQIVLSRQFSQHFSGDEFNVYRALRSINPSPYLFYCDYGGFKLMGSSPEAQLIIQKHQATIYPIAGTFRRTGNDEEDSRLARELFDDPKENSEHVMLVDLARNDLSRNGEEVEVETYKEIQYYSHVIHLVSKVTAQINDEVSSLQLVADTFPAGTLSGAPKHMAMKLINRYENQNRGFYGGCIGYLGFDGNFNQAIMIRSLLSKNNTLYFQAGAGIVAKSNPESELKEVDNKLMALRKAIELANKL